MKKISILIIFIAFAIAGNSQTNKLIGSWLMTKAEIGDKIEEPYFILDFNETGKMLSMEIEVGTWKYDKSNNKIVMESKFDKDFDGESNILKLNKKELVVEKEKVKFYFIKVDTNKIFENNKKSKLSGVWRITDIEDTTIALKFEMPKSYSFINASDGITETTRGTWIYNPKEETIIFIGFSQKLKGKNKIKKHTANEIVLENNGNIIKAFKEDAVNNNIERLTFEYDDFEEENYRNYNLPWIDFNEMITFFKNVKYLKYRNGLLLEEFNILKYNTMLSTVEVNTEKPNIMFTNHSISDSGDTTQYSQNYKGGLSERYNDFFPKEEPWPSISKGVELVTVPAGTFECTVIEGFDDDNKIKYWMINNKPGVYAKIINEKISVFGDLEYFVFELVEINYDKTSIKHKDD